MTALLLRRSKATRVSLAEMPAIRAWRDALADVIPAQLDLGNS